MEKMQRSDAKFLTFTFYYLFLFQVICTHGNAQQIGKFYLDDQS